MLTRCVSLAFLIVQLADSAGLAEAADQVVLVKGEHSVKASVGDDVITVFEFGKRYPKTYFLPITAPGGFAALEENLGKDLPEGSLGKQVYVCSEQANIKVFGNVQSTVKQGEVLNVKHVNGSWAWIPEKNGWIHRRDIAPLVGTITRLINDNPSSTSDRNAPGYYDHPHHKGLWIAVDEVNEVKHWAELAPIENQSVEILTAAGNPATMKYVNHWLGANGKPAVIETTTVQFYPNRVLAFEVHFTAGEAAATFRDTKEGMFAIRLPNSMREFTSGGPVTGADGAQGTKDLWGKPNAWIDYVGKIDGREFGVTIMDHPGNPRPSRYHVRDYGLFALNPFGQKSYTNNMLEEAPLTIEPGQPGVTFKYGLFVHDGVVPTSVIADAFNLFAK